MRRRATELGGAEVDREEEQDALVVPVSHAAAAVWCWASWAARAGSGPDLGPEGLSRALFARVGGCSRASTSTRCAPLAVR
jgi:hypothetical protein